MFMLHFHAAIPRFKSMLHFHAACPISMSMIHFYAAYSRCIPTFHVHPLCQCLHTAFQVAEVQKANFKGPNCIFATFLGHTSVTDSYNRNIVQVRTTVAFAQLWKYSLLSQNRNRITKKGKKERNP
jgi:hypothetical protein